MTNEISEAQLNAFFDGQLDEREEAEVLAFLEANPAVLQRLRTQADQKHQLAAAVDDEVEDEVDLATEDLAARLSARIEKQERRHALIRWSRAGALVVVVGAAGWFGHEAFVTRSDGALPALLADATRDHQLFARSVKPVEFTAEDSDVMVRSFSSHLGQEVRLPDLSDRGYRLVGGRLLGAEEGPFVQLLYDDGDDHLVTIYLAKYPMPAGREPEFTEVAGLGAGYWGADELSYALVAEAPLEQVRTMATAVAAAR